ncbi:hypothetical protein ACWEO2_27190 [Nocardia sp. NPDC004278]
MRIDPYPTDTTDQVYPRIDLYDDDTYMLPAIDRAITHFDRSL